MQLRVLVLSLGLLLSIVDAGHSASKTISRARETSVQPVSSLASLLASSQPETAWRSTPLQTSAPVRRRQLGSQQIAGGAALAAVLGTSAFSRWLEWLSCPDNTCSEGAAIAQDAKAYLAAYRQEVHYNVKTANSAAEALLQANGDEQKFIRECDMISSSLIGLTQLPAGLAKVYQAIINDAYKLTPTYHFLSKTDADGIITTKRPDVLAARQMALETLRMKAKRTGRGEA